MAKPGGGLPPKGGSVSENKRPLKLYKAWNHTVEHGYYIETGEVRPPKEGEWFLLPEEEALRAALNFQPHEAYPIVVKWEPCVVQDEATLKRPDVLPYQLATDEETINHPPHYGGDTTYEAIKVIEAWDLGFNLGNTVKYISRAGKKDPSRLKDLKKALWYLQCEITKEEANGN